MGEARRKYLILWNCVRVASVVNFLISGSWMLKQVIDNTTNATHSHNYLYMDRMSCNSPNSVWSSIFANILPVEYFNNHPLRRKLGMVVAMRFGCVALCLPPLKQMVTQLKDHKNEINAEYQMTTVYDRWCCRLFVVYNLKSVAFYLEVSAYATRQKYIIRSEGLKLWSVLFGPFEWVPSTSIMY